MGQFTPFAQLPFDEPVEGYVNRIKCLIGNTVLSYPHLRSLACSPESLDEKASTYAKYAGPVAEQMILHL